MMISSEVAPGLEERILEEAVRSPSVAMMHLSLEVDRQLRLILAAIGLLKKYTSQSPTEALDLIESTITPGTIFPSELRDTVRSFWDLRNRIVHGGGSQQSLAMRAVDYGLRILRMLSLIPRPRHVILETTLLFSDSKGHRVLRGVRGVVIESFGPKGEGHGRHVYPSRRSYEAGQSVSWEWDADGEGWDEVWYPDSVTNQVRLAWTSSMEFIGYPLELI